MPTEPINFGPQQASGDSPLAGAAPLCMNVVVDGMGAVRRRPGLSAYSQVATMPGEVRAIGYFGADNAALFVSYDEDQENSRIYALKYGVGFSEVSDSSTSTRLLGTARPIIADSKNDAFIIAGKAPQRIRMGLTSERLAGSPPVGNSIASIASRVLIDDRNSKSTRGQIRWCDPGVTGIETWDELEFAEAEARPDELVRIAENTNELWAFGQTTTQIFNPDPVSVFAPGRALNVGCAATHSPIRVDDSFAWLDNQKRFIISDGRGYQELSGGIADTLDGITTVSDCYGFRVNIGQFDCLCWTFPTDGRTFVYQQGGGWAQWSGYTNGRYQPFALRSHHYVDTQDVHLVGLESGRVAEFDTAATTDLGDTIKGEVTTGFINRGTDATKECNVVRLVLKRGQATTAPVLRVSWRDDLGAFCRPVTVSLGTRGDYVHTVELRSLGTYRARQWKLEMSDAADIVVARVEEDFSMGAN